MKPILELRMYGLVPYNISPIQQGIQFGHSKDEMTLAVIEKMIAGGKVDELFYDWLKNWKTYIILNGGTTNNTPIVQTENEFKGSLNNHRESLKANNIKFSDFSEEDLGDQLTAITFIVDERVWDDEKYPDFWGEYFPDPTRQLTDEEFWKQRYLNWEESLGGPQNVFLREFLKPFKFA